MASNFIRFTKADFEAGLGRIVRQIVDAHGYQDVKIKRETRPTTQEVYRVYIGHGLINLRIFSSIQPHTGVSKDHGEDSMKVAVIDDVSEMPLFKKDSYLQRISTWEKNLHKRLEQLFEDVYKFDICQECGAPKSVERQGKFGSFLGCVNYRNHGQSLNLKPAPQAVGLQESRYDRERRQSWSR